MTVNKENISMQEGVSFLNLIEENKILVPKIQRDYAQGRSDPKTSEIRNNFLTSIFDALISKNSAPLLLDFIYGSTDNNIFTPLDGQQRLTTLFLLHWYFIPQDKRSLLFITDGHSSYSRFSYETRISSKDFCNALVTQSSIELKEDLDNHLVGLQKQIDEAECKLNELTDLERKTNIEVRLSNLKDEKSIAKLSTIFKNQSWFLWSWRKDPTVKAMLVMLDEINDRTKYIGATHNEIWEQLENGQIIFHLLPLEQFALTDHLYVKMNARGKELSPFDIFKSSLEEQMQLNKVSEEIQDKWKSNIDSNWIDLFWNKLAKRNIGATTSTHEQRIIVDSVEKSFLTFFKRLIGLYFAENISNLKYDLEDYNIRRLIPFDYNIDENNLTRKLLEQAIQKDIIDLFPLFYKTVFFDDDFFKFVIDVFENLIYPDHGDFKHEVSELVNAVSFSKKNSTLFDSFIGESIDYETYLLFYSLIIFCRTNKTPKLIENVDLKAELNHWIRIIRNLSTLSNSFIDDVEDFQVTLIAYHSWCKDVYRDSGGKSINHYFANHPRTNEPKGRFMKDQFEEEITKAILSENVKNGNEWQKEISDIEEHGYFLGQIRFLLQWSKSEDKYDIKRFTQYKDLVKEIFDSTGLKNELMDKENHLFRNCLMANCENYLLLKDDCFVNSTGKERDRSWKSYLRNSQKSQNIKIILDKFLGSKISSFTEFCKNEKDNGIKTIEDWRRCFLIKPEIYNKCEQDQIYCWDKNNMEICLLETSKKWNGTNRHSELNTFYWHLIFDNQNNWTAKYFNSQTETPLTTTFEKDELKVNVCFENIKGIWKYRVELNFDPKEDEFLYSKNNWSKHFESNNFMDVETYLKKIVT